MNHLEREAAIAELVDLIKAVIIDYDFGFDYESTLESKIEDILLKHT